MRNKKFAIGCLALLGVCGVFGLWSALTTPAEPQTTGRDRFNVPTATTGPTIPPDEATATENARSTLAADTANTKATIAAGAVALHETQTARPPNTPRPPKPPPAPTGMTMAMYSALTNGMTLEETFAVLRGSAFDPAKPRLIPSFCEETSRSDIAGYTTVMFSCEGDGLGANAQLMYQNDELVSKAQFGLE